MSATAPQRQRSARPARPARTDGCNPDPRADSRGGRPPSAVDSNSAGMIGEGDCSTSKSHLRFFSVVLPGAGLAGGGAMYTHARTGGAPLAHGVVVFIGVYLEQARTHPHHRRRVFGPTMLHADGQAWQGCGFIERGGGCRCKTAASGGGGGGGGGGDTVSAVPLQKRLQQRRGTPSLRCRCRRGCGGKRDAPTSVDGGLQKV